MKKSLIKTIKEKTAHDPMWARRAAASAINVVPHEMLDHISANDIVQESEFYLHLQKGSK